jgi:topoisomerase-4 subunit A
MGEPVRLMVDLPNEAEIVALFVHRPGAAADGLEAGDGFVVPRTRCSRRRGRASRC